MSNKNNKKKASTYIPLFIVAPIIGFSLCCAIILSITSWQECEAEGRAYVLIGCREKTIDERFAEKCTKGTTWLDGKNFTCEEIAARGLKRAFVETGLARHGGEIYEKGTYEEIKAGKDSHDYCISAQEAWNHVYETTCVVFSYRYMACASGHCYLDEREDYKNGFVTYFPTNYNWDSFRDAFYGKGPVRVCGLIESFDGHPQITVNDPQRQILLEPTAYGVGDSSYVYYNDCYFQMNISL